MAVARPDDLAPFDPETASMADVHARGWRLAGSCALCKSIHQPHLPSLAASKIGRRPLKQLFDAGKIVCRTHRVPLAGVVVEGDPVSGSDWTVRLKLYQVGSPCDPIVEAYHAKLRHQLAATKPELRAPAGSSPRR